MNDFWKQKLLAYLHDPPSKCADFATHGHRRDDGHFETPNLDQTP